MGRHTGEDQRRRKVQLPNPIQQQWQRLLGEQEPTTALTVVAGHEFFFRQLEERLPYEAAAGIKDGGCEGRVGEQFAFDFLKGRAHTGRIGEIGADAEGFASGGVDLLYNRLEVRWVACEEDNRVGFGESAGDGSSLAPVNLWHFTVYLT